MKYIPKNIEGDENVSKVNPLKELILYLGSIVLILTVIYSSLGYSVHFFIDRLDNSKVVNLHKYIDSKISVSKSLITKKVSIKSDKEKKLEDLFYKVLTYTSFSQDEVSISIVNTKQENAMAYPGRNIVVYNGLIKNVQSENELVFVIAHELGHFHNRHLLKNIGRSFITVAFSFLLSSVESNISDQMMSFLNISNLSFSREQEIESDQFALNVLNKMYKHVNGSDDFFKRTNKKESLLSNEYLSTHPLAKDRIDKLKEYSKKMQYKDNGSLRPWKL